MGFHKIFANIAHFSLDLRANRFETLDPVALYGNLTPWELEGTKIMQGEYRKKFKGQILRLCRVSTGKSLKGKS